MDPRRARALLAAGLSTVLLAGSVIVSSAAPAQKGGRCNPRKTVCTTTSTTSTSTSSTSTTSSSTSTTVPADTTPPTTLIASPAEGTAVAATLGVTGSSTDDREVATVELRVDGGAWTPASGTTSWAMSVDTAAWAPGSTHTIGARAIDAAGNASAVTGVSVQKAATAPPPESDATVAPATQGTWVSPEGVTIDVATAGAWTIRDIYRMLLESSAAPGDFSTIAPTLTVRVQDTTASQTSTTARSSDGVFTRYSATLYLKGISSTFALRPDEVLGHEYGHVWTMYHLYMTQQGDWSSYLQHRWSNADGSLRLAGDARLDSTYGWDRRELIGDDYRLLFGSVAAISQRPTHMNSTVPEPSEVPGLRELFLQTWAAG